MTMITVPQNINPDKIYLVKIKHFYRHFDGDNSFEICIVKVLGKYIQEYILDDFHNITLSIC